MLGFESLLGEDFGMRRILVLIVERGSAECER